MIQVAIYKFLKFIIQINDTHKGYDINKSKVKEGAKNYLVIISAGFGLDAGLALTSSQYRVQSCFGMWSTVLSAGWFFKGPLKASHIRQPKPHISVEL